ncbi:MAG: tellurite resistance TerB family protein [Polyangiaceae bacterium]
MPANTDHLDDKGLEALLELMFLAAQADGEFTSDERQLFSKTATEITHGRLSSAQIEALMLRLEEDFFSYGRETRLKAIRETLSNPEDRRTGLKLAIHMVSEDGIIRTSERELLLEVAEALDIDASEAADLVKAASK